MAEQRERTRSGIGWLKKNDSDNPKAPVFKGKVKVDDREHEIAAFRPEDGKETYSVSLEPATERSERDKPL